jgi:hypothetical protein
MFGHASGSSLLVDTVESRGGAEPGPPVVANVAPEQRRENRGLQISTASE